MMQAKNVGFQSDNISFILAEKELIISRFTSTVLRIYDIKKKIKTLKILKLAQVHI